MTEDKLLSRRVDDDGTTSALLPILPFIDATLLDATGKYSTKPICITLGTFPMKMRV